MAIRLIAFDLDDTLLRDDLTVSGEDIAAIRLAAERGIHILPASGRRLSAMGPALQAIGHQGPVISFNGAYASMYPSGEALYQRFLPPEACLTAVQTAKQLGAYIQLYDQEDFLFETHCGESRLYAEVSGGGGTAVGDLSAFIHNHNQPSQKMLVIENDPGKIERVRIALKDALGEGISIFYSKPHYLELTHPEASKGHAIAAIAQRYGIAPKDVLAIGDGENDLPMLTFAGIGVAMGNASEAVRQKADAVTATNMQGGVGLAIRKYVLS